MPRHCSAAGCKSRDTRETRKAGITFHRLPKRGKPRRTLWILNSRRTGPQGKGQWDPQSHFIYFCSKHFTPESFELSGVSGYRRLKEDALPTVFETVPRQRRGAGEKAQRGRSKQTPAKRQTRRQTRPLKQEKAEWEPAGQAGGGGCPDAGKGEEKTEAVGWDEDDNKSAGGAENGACTLPPAPSPPPPSSSIPRPSPGPPQIPSTSPSPPPPSEIPPPSPSSSPADPPSPSRYMRRLPPPPGFYLAKEHSYAQLCPQVWRKRYDRAIDSLEKSTRLLNAARRRENRLRHALLQLRESHIGAGGREPRPGRGGAAGPRERGVRQGAEESEAERAEKDLSLIEDGLGETGEWDRRAPSGRARAGSEEEAGFCFYCGRGRGEEGGEEDEDGVNEESLGGRPRKPCRVVEKKEQEEEGEEETGGEAGKEECCYYYYCEDGEGGTRGRETGLHIVTLELAAPKREPQRPSRPAMTPMAPGAPPQPLPWPTVQLLQQDGGAGPGATQGPEEQRVFWVQEGAEGRLLLLPEPAEEGSGADRVGKDGGAGLQAFQSLTVSAVGFQKGDGEGGRRGPRTAGRGHREGGARSSTRTAVGSGDVRERLKEHLEGFQLQLSNEFVN